MGSKIEPGRVSSVNGRNEPASHTVSGAVAALKMSCAETTAPSRLVLRGSARWSGASRKSTTNVSSAISIAAMIGEVERVSPDPGEASRAPGVEPRQPEEIDALASGHPAPVRRLSGAVERRRVEPAKVRAKADAPE